MKNEELSGGPPVLFIRDLGKAGEQQSECVPMQ